MIILFAPFFFFPHFSKQNFDNPFTADYFDEKVVVRPLSDGRVITHFDFFISSDLKNGQIGNFLFPKSIRQIIEKTDVRHLELSFAQGSWDGYFGEEFAPSQNGLELEADFEDGEEVEKRWKELLDAFSGNFCGSFKDSHIKKFRTFTPINEKFKRVEIVPNEPFCVENLSAFLDLLPCRAHAGMASLLNQVSSFDSDYISAKLIADKNCSESGCNLKMEILITIAKFFKKKIGKSNLFKMSDLFDRNYKNCVLSKNRKIVFEALSSVDFFEFFEDDNVFFDFFLIWFIC
ncbi:Subunit of the glycosylphosphatidylinositol transamidase complex-like protein [Bonamia ostreae]|uniref:Subunit of the glycosylphosphatidylinositol transamidase complex-like protein n=1 Tax=Bonamia ostreae TaxID=126728 RepID=A0ABV2APP5_9EUKA